MELRPRFIKFFINVINDRTIRFHEYWLPVNRLSFPSFVKKHSQDYSALYARNLKQNFVICL